MDSFIDNNFSSSPASSGSDLLAGAFVCFIIVGISIVLIQLIFFVKMWNMTNDVAAIKKTLEDDMPRRIH